MNNPISKIDRGLSLSEKTEQQILEAIKQKIYIPGDKLNGEMELAQNFGVSRTVVREALHRLAGRGILEAKKGSGFFVANDQYSFVTNSMFDLLEMKCGNSSLINIANIRMLIEPGVAKLAAANRTNEDLKALKRSYSEMEANLNNPKKMIVFDIEFHRLIINSSKNPILPVIMEPILQLMAKFISDTYEYPHSPILALKWHKKILTFIEEKNKIDAFAAMHAHMEEAQEHAIKISKL